MGKNKDEITYEQVVSYIMNTENLSREEASIRADMMPMSEMQQLLSELQNSTPRQYVTKREIKRLLYEFACELADAGYLATLELSDNGAPYIKIAERVPIAIVYFASTKTYRVYADKVPYATVSSQAEVVAAIKELLK